MTLKWLKIKAQYFDLRLIPISPIFQKNLANINHIKKTLNIISPRCDRNIYVYKDGEDGKYWKCWDIAF